MPSTGVREHLHDRGGVDRPDVERQLEPAHALRPGNLWIVTRKFGGPVKIDENPSRNTPAGRDQPTGALVSSEVRRVQRPAGLSRAAGHRADQQDSRQEHHR